MDGSSEGNCLLDLVRPLASALCAASLGFETLELAGGRLEVDT